MVQLSGVGEMKPVRETDLSPTLAAERYRQFKDQVYESLRVVREVFHFTFIVITIRIQQTRMPYAR
jgi:hypothetical protein